MAYDSSLEKPARITTDDVDWLIPRVGREWLESKIRAGKYIVTDEETRRGSKDSGPLNMTPSNLVFLKQIFPGDVIDEMIRQGDYIPVDENGNKIDRPIKSWRQKPKTVWLLRKFTKCRFCKQLILVDSKYCSHCSKEMSQKRSAKKRPNPSSTLRL